MAAVLEAELKEKIAAAQAAEAAHLAAQAAAQVAEKESVDTYLRWMEREEKQKEKLEANATSTMMLEEARKRASEQLNATQVVEAPSAYDEAVSLMHETLAFEAATLIQKVWRGFMKRKDYRDAAEYALFVLEEQVTLTLI